MQRNSPFELDGYDPEFIKNISLFAGLPDAEKEGLLKSGRVLSFPRGKALFYQGDELSNFYVICSGVVQLSRTTPDGREITLDILIGGDMTCAKEIFELSEVHMVNATAVNATTVLSFPRAWLLEAAQKSGIFALNLLSTISRRARAIEVDAEHQATMSASQLVTCFLVHLCARYNFNPRNFQLPFSKSLIASRLGMELETLSRTIPVIGKHGVEVKGKQVALKDFAAIDDNVCNRCSVRESCQARMALGPRGDEVSRVAKAPVRVASS